MFKDKMFSDISQKQKRIIIYSALVSAVVILTFSFLLKFPEKWIWPDSSESSSENRLEVTMSIQRIIGDSVYFAFNVTNKFNKEVYIQADGFNSPGQSDLQNYRPEQKLRPGGSLIKYSTASITGIGNDFLKSEDLILETDYTIRYNFSENPNSENLQETFTFSLPKKTIQVRTYFPTKTSFDSNLSELTFMLAKAQDQLALNEGTIIIVINLSERHNIPGLYPIVSNYKMGIFYSNISKKFYVLKYIDNKSDLVIEFAEPNKNKDLHLLTLSWSDSMLTFTVDNEKDTTVHF